MNKIKIGIITFHSSVNYGAYLQAYGLSKAIRKTLNSKVEIINYTPGYKKLFYLLKVLASIRNGYFFKYLKQYWVFKKSEKFLPLSKPLKTSNYSKQCKFLNDNYSAIVIGSDEVLTAGKTKRRPFPNLYWPSQLVTIPKHTYAASANRSDYSKLSAKDKKTTNTILEQYNYIGVRDEYTYNQIMNLNRNLKPKINCDPTFLFNFNTEFYEIKESLKSRFRKLTRKPILALMTKNAMIGKLIKEHFENEYYIMAVYYPNENADHFFADMNPFEWATAFSLYTGCVSQLFHATVFSIKNNLPFISFDNNPQYDGRSTKISDILQKTNLEENYFDLRDDNFSEERFVGQLEKNIEKPQVDKMTTAVRNQQILFNSFVQELKDNLSKHKI